MGHVHRQVNEDVYLVLTHKIGALISGEMLNLPPLIGRSLKSLCYRIVLKSAGITNNFKLIVEAQNFGKWLGTRFTAGDGWDKIVREILTVEGMVKDKPQAIFFGLVGEGGKVTAGGSSRAAASLFMGVQLQCAECHDDPYRAWAQKEHWAMAAFFSRVTGSFADTLPPPKYRLLAESNAQL